MAPDRPGQWPIVFAHERWIAERLGDCYIDAMCEGLDLETWRIDWWTTTMDEASGFWVLEWTWWDGRTETHRVAEVGWT